MFESLATAEPDFEEVPAPLARPLTDERGMVDFGETLRWLSHDSPGPAMMNMAALLASTEQALTPEQRIDLARLVERCESWLGAVKQQVFAGIARDAGSPTRSDDNPGPFEDTLLETALALNWSEWMVYNRMETAEEIIDRLPDTWQALAEGDINYWQAHKIAEATRKIEDDEKAAVLEQRVLAKASTLTRSETGKLVDRELIKADPEGAEKRRKTARKGRQVTRSRDEDGMANLHVHGPVEDIAAIDIALSRGADMLKAAGRVENLDQGRFDTLLSWACNFLGTQNVPAASGRPTTLGVVAKETTLSGQDNDPGHLDRWGPVTAQVARDLAAGTPPRQGPDDDDDDPYGGPPDDPDPPDRPPPPSSGGVGKPIVTVRTLRVDPVTGWLQPPLGIRVDFGTEKAYFTAEPRQFVLERFRLCEFPGCAMPMTMCDADHWKERSRGGATDATTNAGPGCPHHNRTTKNRAGWTIEPTGDGTATLITPQGRRYPITPFNYLD